MTEPQHAPRFVRDGATWILYLTLGYYAFFLNVLGPLVPFVRAERGLSYTVGSLHFSAFAVGMIIAGLTADRVVRALGRPRTLLIGGAGLVAGAALLLVGRDAVLTIGGALVMGTLGSLLLAVIPAALADQHGAARALALSEANTVAALCSLLGPLLVGIAAQTNVGWRAAPIATMLLWGLLAPMTTRVTVARAVPISAAAGDPAGRLPQRYWRFWSALVLVIAVEFSVAFWSTEYLARKFAVAPGVAATLATTFLAAIFVGRFVAGGLLRRSGPAQLLPAALALTLLGFLAYWLAPTLWLSVAGLFVCGLGLANLYPFVLTLAVDAAGTRSSAASARASLASGTAVLSAPLLLAALADQISLGSAYGVVVLLLVGAFVLVRIR